MNLDDVYDAGVTASVFLQRLAGVEITPIDPDRICDGTDAAWRLGSCNLPGPHGMHRVGDKPERSR